MIMTVFLCLMSVITFILYGLDKRKAVKHRWRIPEAALLLFSVPGGIGGLLGMFLFRHKTRKWKFRILVPLFAVIDALLILFFLWAADYYRADDPALAAMRSDSVVAVEKTGTGWLFDGPSEENTLIFYPGGKVDEKAYAPLLRRLAEEEMDVYLVKMPLHFAFMGINKAEDTIRTSDYDHYYIGGHSLGGAMAVVYAAKHEETLDGVILLASYPASETALDTLLIYGSEDGVLNRKRVEEADELITGTFNEYVIEGGNHAQFGSYGEQAGDGKAELTEEEQQRQTVDLIRKWLDQTGTAD